MYFDYAQYKQKGFSLIIILVGVVVIGVAIGGVYYFGKSQTPQPTTGVSSPVPTGTDETANWKTYTGKNYTFKYPETWVVKEHSADEDKGLTFYIFSPDYSPDPNFEDPHEGGNIVGAKSGSRLEVTSQINPIIKSYEDYKKHWEINSVGWHGYSFEKKEEITFNGTKVMVSTGGKPDGLGRLSAGYFYKDDRIYDVVLISFNHQDIIFNQILSTFKFLDQSWQEKSRTGNKQSQEVDLKDIKYTLPQGWKAEIRKDALGKDGLFIGPESGGGYFLISVYNYPGTLGRRQYYCQVSKVCIEGTSYFTERNIGNISGYAAYALDNSGGGTEYFGVKGNKFYVISSFSPPLPNEFDKNRNNVLDSLIF